MSFWCSVSDRCSGKIGEGEVPPARLQLCLLSLFGTKGSCHICHDWCGCRRIVGAYLHETPEGETAPAGRFCVAIICPAHSPAARTPRTHARTRAATQPQSVYISGNDSSRRTGPSVISPSVSFAIACHRWAYAPWGASQTSQQDVSPSCLSSSYHSEMLMKNDVLRRNHFTLLDNEEY